MVERHDLEVINTIVQELTRLEKEMDQIDSGPHKVYRAGDKMAEYSYIFTREEVLLVLMSRWMKAANALTPFGVTTPVHVPGWQRSNAVAPADWDRKGTPEGDN